MANRWKVGAQILVACRVRRSCVISPMQRLRMFSLPLSQRASNLVGMIMMIPKLGKVLGAVPTSVFVPPASARSVQGLSIVRKEPLGF